MARCRQQSYAAGGRELVGQRALHRRLEPAGIRRPVRGRSGHVGRWTGAWCRGAVSSRDGRQHFGLRQPISRGPRRKGAWSGGVAHKPPGGFGGCIRRVTGRCWARLRVARDAGFNSARASHHRPCAVRAWPGGRGWPGRGGRRRSGGRARRWRRGGCGWPGWGGRRRSGGRARRRWCRGCGRVGRRAARCRGYRRTAGGGGPRAGWRYPSGIVGRRFVRRCGKRGWPGDALRWQWRSGIFAWSCGRAGYRRGSLRRRCWSSGGVRVRRCGSGSWPGDALRWQRGGGVLRPGRCGAARCLRRDGGR